MLKELFRRTSTKKQHISLKDKPFVPIRTSKKEGILNIEEIENRIGGGTVSGYYHLVRAERVEGELLEIVKHTESYHRHLTSRGFFDLYDPTEHVKGVKLKIRDDGGVEGEVYFPEEFPSRVDKRAMLNQRVGYKHKSDQMCERCLGGDNRSHAYSLTILTGQLEGEKYFQEKFENL